MNSEDQAKGSSSVELIVPAKSSRPVASASKLAGIPRAEMEQRFTQALGDAAAEVFAMMVGTALGPPEDATEPHSADYTAMIGLAGELCGVLSFRCSNATAGQIAGKMLGTDEAAADECIRDALGEICNMVAGAFKALVSDLATPCMLSVPTVVSGNDYRLYPLADGLRIQVSPSFQNAQVWMSLDLQGI